MFENLETLYLSGCKRLTHINGGAFAGCKKLANIIFPEPENFVGGFTIDDECFKNCKELKEVTIKGSVQCIKTAVFMGCEKLSKLTFATRWCSS